MMLDGRIAVVTGAGQGLGRAEAVALARSGARVVVNDIGSRAHDVVDEIRSEGGEAIAHLGDVSMSDVAEDLITVALSQFGDLDILVNNAGIVRDRTVFNMSDDEWDSVLRVHLRGHFATTRAATVHWRGRAKANGPRDAAIVNTSSEAFLNTPAGQPNYAAAKAGIVALTLSTAKSCRAYGVRANAICPRADTPMTAPVLSDLTDPERARLGPEHVAPLVVFLGSERATNVTGSVFVAYGARIGVLAPPTLEATFDSPDGRWSADDLAGVIGEYAGDGGLDMGFSADAVVAAGSDIWGATSDQQHAATRSLTKDQHPDNVRGS